MKYSARFLVTMLLAGVLFWAPAALMAGSQEGFGQQANLNWQDLKKQGSTPPNAPVGMLRRFTTTDNPSLEKWVDENGNITTMMGSNQSGSFSGGITNTGADITSSTIAAPITFTAALASGGQLSTGVYLWQATFVTAGGETEAGAASNSVSASGGTRTGSLSAIPVSTNSTVTSRKIYRTLANGATYYFVATIANNTETTYSDSVSDASISGNPAIPTTNTTGGRLLAADGTAAAPSVSFTNNLTSGLYSNGTGVSIVGGGTEVISAVATKISLKADTTAFNFAGTDKIRAVTGQVNVSSDTVFNFFSQNDLGNFIGAYDVGLKRSSAGVIGVTDGSSGAGSLTATNLTSTGTATTAGLVIGIRTITNSDSPYTIVAGDNFILADATGGAITIVADATAKTGRTFTFKKVDGGGNAVNFDPTSIQSVDGAATKATTTQYASFTVTSNGTSWFIQ